MPKEKAPRDLFVSIGAPGESLLTTFNREERRVDDLTLADYRQMRDNDGMIQMLINAIVNTILSSGIEIQDPDIWTKSNEGPSEEKLFLEQNLLQPKYVGGMSRSMDLTNRIILRALEEGYRVFEVVYRLDESGKIYLDKLAPRAGLNNFDMVLLVDDNGEYLGFKQRTSFLGKIYDVTVTNEGGVAKTIKATFGAEYGSQYGRSALKAPWYHYDKAHKALFLNHVAHELGALKARVIKHNAVDEDVIRGVVGAVSKVYQESVIALDQNSFELEVLELSDAKAMEQGRETTKLHYDLMAKALLAQVVNLGSSMSDTGSRALGDVQLKLFKVGLEAIARILIEDTWNTVIPDLITINFNRGIFPKLVVKPISDERVDFLNEIFMEVIKKGQATDSVLKDVLEKGAEQAGLSVAPEEIEADFEKKDQEKQQTQEAELQAMQKPLQPFNNLDQSTEHKHVHLDDGEMPETKEVRPLYLDEQKVRFVDIREKLITTEDQLKYTLKRKSDVQKNAIVDSYITALRSGRKAVAKQKVELQEESSYSEELLTSILGIFEFGKITSANELNKGVPQTPENQRRDLVDMVNAAIKEQEARLQLRLTSIANKALVTSLPENQVRILLEQDYEDFFNKIIAPTVGALVPEGLNRGRQVTFNRYSGDIFAYRYSAILDSRTTDYCRELDGRVFQSSDPNFIMLTPPNHFGCRSIWVPITYEEEQQEQMRVNGKPSGLPVYASISGFKDEVDEVVQAKEEEHEKIEREISDLLLLTDARRDTEKSN